MADVGVLLFFLFDKDSCVFHPISLSGMLHGFSAVFVVVTYFVVLSAVFSFPVVITAITTRWTKTV